MNTIAKQLFAAAALALGASAFAAGDHAGGHGQAPAAAAPAAAKLTSAEVRKVDAEQGKVTLKHEAIENLEMPAMTMVFRVATPEMLSGLKAGDKVLFRAESSGGAITVTELRKAQ